jgi:integrase
MGSIRQLPSGNWRVRWRDPGTLKERGETFSRKRPAQAFLSQVEGDAVRGLYHDPALGRISLRDFWPRFLESSPHLRPSTRAGYEFLWRKHVEPVLGARALGSLSRLEVEGFVSGLTRAGAGPATVAAAFKLLRRLLSAAEASGIVAKNAARGVKTPKAAREEMRFLTAEEVERIAEEAPRRYRALVLTLGFCGLRIGEAAALTVDRTDLLRRRLRVTETVSEVGGRLHFGPPKTPESVRAVALPHFVAEAIALHLAEFPPGSNGLVFTASEGGPIYHTTFRRRVWLPAVRAAGIAEPFPRVHDLRHTAASLMIAAGGHPKQIQAQLGHSSITVTLDRYGHLFETLADQLADRIGSMRESGVARSWHAGDSKGAG